MSSRPSTVSCIVSYLSSIECVSMFAFLSVRLRVCVSGLLRNNGMNPFDPLYRQYPGIYRFTWKPFDPLHRLYLGIYVFMWPSYRLYPPFTYLHNPVYRLYPGIYIFTWKPFDPLNRLYPPFTYLHNPMYRLYPGIYVFIWKPFDPLHSLYPPFTWPHVLSVPGNLHENPLTLCTVCIRHLRIYMTPCTVFIRGIYIFMWTPFDHL